MTPEKLSARHVATLLFLLRNHAARQRFEHGPMVENPGGLELTPTEMETWADEIEAAHAVPGKPVTAREAADVCGDALQAFADALPGNSEDEWLTT